MDTNGSQFSIVWPDYQKKISDGYTHFQQHEEFVDMTLAADGHYVKVHQFIVALASPYLKEIIKSIPTKHPVIFLHNVSYSELCQILEYIYTGEVNVPHNALNNFLKSGKALKLEGISSLSATTPQSNSTVNEPCEVSPLATAGTTEETDEKIKYTKTAQSYADDILSELEQRMSFVKDTQEETDFDDIIQVRHVTSKPSSSSTKKLDTDKVDFVSSESQGQVKEKTGKLKIVNIEIEDIESVHDRSDFENYCGNRVLKSMEPNQELTESSTSVMPLKSIRSGKMGVIGQKTIVVSKRAEKRKSEHLSSRQHKTSKSMVAEDTLSIPSIVIENNPGGHSITIKQPELVSTQDDAETVTLPSYEQTSSSELVHSSLDVNIQRCKPTLTRSTAVMSSFSVPEKSNPGIELAANNTLISMETQCSVGPSTSAPRALGANDLINLDSKERTDLTAELKGGTPQLYTISNKGTLQMILNRYMYYPHYAAYAGRKRRWRCVDYRRQHCQAYLDTDGEIIVKRVNPHSHTFHDKRILEKLEKKAVFSTMANAKEDRNLGPQTVSSENID